jgi:hypothetical protein
MGTSRERVSKNHSEVASHVEVFVDLFVDVFVELIGAELETRGCCWGDTSKTELLLEQQ